jgi:hypothetical protein
LVRGRRTQVVEHPDDRRTAGERAHAGGAYDVCGYGWYSPMDVSAGSGVSCTISMVSASRWHHDRRCRGSHTGRPSNRLIRTAGTLARAPAGSHPIRRGVGTPSCSASASAVASPSAMSGSCSSPGRTERRRTTSSCWPSSWRTVTTCIAEEPAPRSTSQPSTGGRYSENVAEPVEDAGDLGQSRGSGPPLQDRHLGLGVVVPAERVKPFIERVAC